MTSASSQMGSHSLKVSFTASLVFAAFLNMLFEVLVCCVDVLQVGSSLLPARAATAAVSHTLWAYSPPGSRDVTERSSDTARKNTSLSQASFQLSSEFLLHGGLGFWRLKRQGPTFFSIQSVTIGTLMFRPPSFPVFDHGDDDFFDMPFFWRVLRLLLRTTH